MHSTEARPKAHLEYMRKRIRSHTGASPLSCRSRFNIGRISVERLVSVDANSRLGGFLPAAPKLHGFGICLPPQNAAYYTTTRRQKTNPRQKSSARATTNTAVARLCTFQSMLFLFLSFGSHLKSLRLRRSYLAWLRVEVGFHLQ